MFGANLSIFDRVLIVFQLVLSVYVLIRVGIDALGFDDFAKVPPGEWGRLGYLAITIWWVLAAVAATAILIKNRWGWWLQSLVVSPLLVLVCYSLIVTVQEGQRGGYNAKVVMQGILFVFGMASIQFLAIRQALGHWRIKSDRA